jgi:hypothetical protein
MPGPAGKAWNEAENWTEGSSDTDSPSSNPMTETSVADTVKLSPFLVIV